jgi:hypothetical protein
MDVGAQWSAQGSLEFFQNRLGDSENSRLMAHLMSQLISHMESLNVSL